MKRKYHTKPGRLPNNDGFSALRRAADVRCQTDILNERVQRAQRSLAETMRCLGELAGVLSLIAEAAPDIANGAKTLLDDMHRFVPTFPMKRQPKGGAS